MKVGDWIGDYRYLLAVEQEHDGTMQHRFVHRGGQWAMLFKTEFDAADEALAVAVQVNAPMVEAAYQAGGGGQAAFVIDAGRVAVRLAFSGRAA